MPYAIPAGSIAEIQWRYKIQGQQCINVFHYKNDVSMADGATNLIGLMNEFDPNVANVFQSYQTTEVVEGRIRGQWVYPTRYVYEEQPMVDDAGTSAPPTVSIGTCLVVRRKSQLASRSARGRIYFGGLAGSYLTIGTWNSTLTPVIKGLMQDAVKAAFVVDGVNFTPVIWSYADPGNADEVVTSLVDPYARYQRRREVGRGE